MGLVVGCLTTAPGATGAAAGATRSGGIPPLPLRAAIAGSARSIEISVNPTNNPCCTKPAGRSLLWVPFDCFIVISQKISLNELSSTRTPHAYDWGTVGGHSPDRMKRAINTNPSFRKANATIARKLFVRFLKVFSQLRIILNAWGGEFP